MRRRVLLGFVFTAMVPAASASGQWLQRPESAGPPPPPPERVCFVHSKEHVPGADCQWPRGTPGNRPPRYPAKAYKAGIGGRVELLVHVTEKGRVDGVRVWHSSGSSALDAAAMKATKHWKFLPGKVRGVPHEMDVPVPITFVATR